MRRITPRYDAFVSYSHAGDRVLADALQSELQTFARPLLRPRALRIFRDASDLAATPHLWPTIEHALASSDWFILMASPQAAASPWVGREIDWWRRNRPAERILIALTDGRIEWTGTDFDWSTTDALPRILSGAFAAEPKWIDLRKLRPVGADESAPRPRLGDVVAEFAAPIRNVPKDSLVGDHLALRRRIRLAVRTTIATLSVLLIAALVATWVAIDQRDEAQTQARIATARLLATTSAQLLPARLDLAQLLAVEAVRMNDDRETRAALFAAVTSSPALVRFLRAGAPVTAVAGSADGRAVVAGTASGRVLRWDVAGGPGVVVAELAGPVAGVAADADGSTIAATGGSAAVSWTRDRGARRLPVAVAENGPVAVSPSGRYLALSGAAGELALLDAAGTLVTQTPDASAAQLALPSDTELVTMTAGIWERRTVPALRRTAGSTIPTGTHGFGNTMSPNGDYFAFTNGGSEVFVTDIRQTETRDLTARSHGSSAQAFAVSADGLRVAVADAGTIYVAPISQETSVSDVQIPLTGGGAVPEHGVAFLGDNRHLVSATGDALILWDLDQLTRIGDRATITAPLACSACAEPAVAVSPDGRRVTTTADEGRVMSVFDRSAGTEQIVNNGDVEDGFNVRPVGWGADGTTLYTANGESVEARPAADLTRVDRTIPTPDQQPVLAVSADGTRLVVVGRTGIETRDATSGKVLEVSAELPGTTEASQVLIDPGLRTIVARSYTDTGDEVSLVDLADRRVRPLGSGDVRDVAVGADVAVVQRETGALELWRFAGDRPFRTIVQDASFMPSGASTSSRPAVGGPYVAQRRADGRIVITDIRDGEQLGLVELPAGTDIRKTGLAFTPDGGRLITVTEANPIVDDALLVQWNLDPATWQQIACRTAGRDLTDAEWARYAAAFERTGRTCEPATIDATTAGPSAPPPLPTDLLDGRHPAYLATVDAAGRTAGVDLVEIQAESEVVNESPRLRTVRIADPVTVTAPEPDTGFRLARSLPLRDLPAYLAARPGAADGRLSTSVYWVTVAGGRVTRLEEWTGS